MYQAAMAMVAACVAMLAGCSEGAPDTANTPNLPKASKASSKVSNTAKAPDTSSMLNTAGAASAASAASAVNEANMPNTPMTPEGVAEAFVQAVTRGDVDAVLALVHVPADIQTETKDKLFDTLRGQIADGKKMIDSRGGLVRLEITSVAAAASEKYPERTNVEHVVHFKDGSQEKGTVVVVKPAGKWRLYFN